MQQQQQQQQQLQYLQSQQQDVDSIEANKGYTFEEQFKQLYELSDHPKRKEFLDDLFQFMADRNQPVNRIPIMAKQVLDLYELYNLVVARGGLVEVINKKIWREITKGLNLPSSITSAAFTLRTQYMKYLYPYECAKNNFSQQDELQQAIDGNRREGRRAGSGSLSSAYAAATYLGQAPALVGVNQLHGAGSGGGGTGNNNSLNNLSGSNSDSNSNYQHLNSYLNSIQQQLQQNSLNSNNNNNNNNLQESGSHLNSNHLIHHQRDGLIQRSQSNSSSLSASSATFGQQRLYQDSIESDHDEDEGSIDLGHSSKRNSPIIEPQLQQQHLDPHLNLSQQQVAEQQQQLAAAAAAAAAIRQQLGAAINFAGTQNFLTQLTGHHHQTRQVASPQAPQPLTNNHSGLANSNATSNNNGSAAAVAAAVNNNHNNSINSNSNNNNISAGNNLSNTNNQAGDLIKQQQEQFLAALMTAANQQQQQSQQHQQQTTGSNPQQQQQPGLNMMASNAMLIAAPNAPDAMAIANAAQAIGVKGAFIILLL